MTWAKTKHDDGSDGSFTEEDFRKRKAHPNFKDHLTLEKNVTKYGKSEKLKTIIVNSGILYHAGDGLFHNFLKVYFTSTFNICDNRNAEIRLRGKVPLSCPCLVMVTILSPLFI